MPDRIAEEPFARTIEAQLRRLAVAFSAGVLHGLKTSELGPPPTLSEMPTRLRSLADEIERGLDVGRVRSNRRECPHCAASFNLGNLDVATSETTPKHGIHCPHCGKRLDGGNR